MEKNQRKKINNFLLIIAMGYTVIMAIGSLVTYLMYAIFSTNTELISELLLLSTITGGVVTAIIYWIIKGDC